MQHQKPFVGRVVHYVAFGTPNGEYLAEHRAAIVTVVHSDTCIGIAILNPTGLFFIQSILQDEAEKKSGTWHWPERE
jgi:hypothetical protein